MRGHMAWAFLALWAASILAALLVYGQKQLSEFDPNAVLLHHSTAASFDHDVVEQLRKMDIQAGSIVHIGSTQDCYCERLTEPHQRQLVSRLNPSYELISTTIETQPSLKNFIPSTPALIVLDDAFQLRYIGPYATGYGCFTGKNLVDTIVSYTQQSPYNGAVVNADATGCFCT